jgi:hypothetical protein
MNKPYFGIERKKNNDLPSKIIAFWETKEEADAVMRAGKFGKNYKIVEVDKNGKRLEIYSAE